MSTTANPEYIRKTNVVENLVRSKIFWVLFLLFGFSYPIYRSMNRTLPPELPVIAQVPEFELISENGQRFGSKDLKGKVYLANFIFSRCPSVCPKMLGDLEKIQKRVRGTGQKVAIVTFTVDPEYDNEKVLFDLARKHDANPYTWTFLTGSDKEGMFKLYRDGFKVGVENNVQNIMEIAHTEKIVLVDGENRIRGYYAFDENSVNQLMIDVGLLINRPSTKE
ncbi:SCO family protein [Peredibacter starrii]|uniref:SCO family protein n=1 Tax=Peredibacter starrii TaxID=28202 RepID=A0AAX4HLI6_9BACT|nr:SCO family protein [Peredibacter starrii]WPU63804.1 SCO family protein [Peredibacter starrii]